LQVAKRRDPAVLTVDRYGDGDAEKGGGDSPPAPPRPDAPPRTPTTQDATVLANGENKPTGGGDAPTLSPPAPRQDGVSVNGENKSTVAATATPPSTIAKVVIPDSVPILPPSARYRAPESGAPAEKTPPSSRSNSSAPPKSSTASDVASAEEMIADIVEKASKPKTLSPPAPTVQEPWDFKKYIGFEDPVEVKDDGWAVPDGAGSFEHHQNHDSGPLAGENVMNVILVSAECSPWCKTGICVITLQPPLLFIQVLFDNLLI
jgi:starch synthase